MDQETSDQISELPELPGYGVTERALAGVLLVACAVVAFICADVLSGGRIVGALSAAPELPGGEA